MESNNIVAAPQVADIDTLFGIWKQTHSGSKDDFYVFLTAPSAEREIFLSAFEREVIFDGAIVSAIVRP